MKVNHLIKKEEHILKSSLINVLRKHVYNLSKFHQDCRTLQKASSEQLKSGEFDNVVKRCIRYCGFRKDRFLFHKLVYALFSEVNYIFRAKNEQLNILSWLLYDKDSNLQAIAIVLQDAYQAWKNNPVKEVALSQDFKEILLLLRSIASVIFQQDKFYEDDLIKIFGIKKTTVRNVNPFQTFEPVRNYLEDLKEFLLSYVSETVPVVKDFLAFKLKCERLSSDQFITGEEVKQIFKSLWDFLNENKNIGVVPQATHWGEKFFSADKKINLSHGGGLFFLTDFLYGRNKGYVVAKEEKGIGIYLDPFRGNTNYSPQYYATRNPVRHFDIPVIMSCNAQIKSLGKSSRHNDEAILRHTHRRDVSISRLDTIPVNDLHGLCDLNPIVLQIYQGEEFRNLRMQICESVLRLFKLAPDVALLKEWKLQLSLELVPKVNLSL